ncbi:lysozyme inhibitor LprI family protein [Pseudomonas fluorescens]|uniref:Urease-associated protein n=1 Tax=Pseudomonas fluorescens TaxID=294 RepID=A0A161YXV3_PSEFL|nr:lysozyme inhibitor LprI family protein [Pseudomonas fluorescens]KZN15657.1 urease-associated protein [Pseudomonas fluorescens]
MRAHHAPRFLLALTPLLLTPLAHAIDCDNATDQSTMNQCAAQQNKAVDKELNALYQQITTRLKDDPDAKKLLVGAQRSWIAFRDAECKFSASGVAGGSVYPLIYSNCTTELTKARVEAFKTYLKCQEGDLSCPVPEA